MLFRRLRFFHFVSLFLILANSVYSQTQLSFTGTPTFVGITGAVGTTYTWANVGTSGSSTIRARITIVSVTGSPVLENIDGTGTGSLNAWQPIIRGSGAANTCWGMQFRIDFFDAATNLPLTLSSFNAAGVDIDGNGANLVEYNRFSNPYSYTIEGPAASTPSQLTITNNAGIFEYRAPVTVYAGVSLPATQVIVSTNYRNVNSLTLVLGSCCTSSACNSGTGNRLHSINFFDAIPFNNPVTTTLGSTLPVKLVNFAATKISGGNMITWKSSFEENFSHYSVQRSLDGIHFSDIASITGKGTNSAYTYFDDIAAETGIIYYRLKSVDLDDKFSISEIVTVKFRTEQLQQIRLSPNPVHDYFAIRMQSALNQQVDFNIVNNDGRIVKTISRYAIKGDNIFQMDVDNFLPAGVYQVIAKTKNEIIAYTKLIKR